MRPVCFGRTTLLGTDPPGEFQLFWPGENPSTKGPVWFDDVSALRVMAEAGKYANDYIVDLEHRSVAPRLLDPNNSDTDAMAWHRIEVRRTAEGPELWAVRVSWTPEGDRRLRARSQRYYSPAFWTEKDEQGRNRVVRYRNCALCSEPATYGIPPLVASAYAGERTHLDTRTEPCDASRGMGKDRQAMAAALASLDEGDAVAAQSTLRAAMAEEEDEAAPEEEATDPESEEDEPPPEPQDEEYTRARDAVIALAGNGVSDLPSALRVLAKRAQTVTGAADVAGAAAFMSGVLRERAQREVAELRAVVTELVDLGAETPATAFADGAPVARLVSEGLTALRARATALRAARPALHPPASGAGNPEDGLEDFERRDAAKIKDPEVRARWVASRLARKQKAQ